MRLVIAIVAAVLLGCGPAHAAGPERGFDSSDALLNLIWDSSVQTARDMQSPPVDLDRRGCAIDLPQILLDGAERDRCPYVGDLAVTGMTLLVSQDDQTVLRDMIRWFGTHQNSDGSIPASPFRDGTTVLVDYNAYWLETLYDYVLYTGDTALLRTLWPRVVQLVDQLYPLHVANGLLVNWLGPADYAYIPRGGNRVAYYSAQYVRALQQASALAGWAGDAGRQERWLARTKVTAAAFGDAFWDPGAGAFSDTTADTGVHPLDGNVFAILAGLATPAQTQSVLTYIDRTMGTSYGDSIADDDGWRGEGWGPGDNARVYPFISYYEVLARYAAGADASALGLIREVWGFMATRDPGTMWETIGSATGGPADGTPSWDHGWSSGAAPALTTYVLGVQPTAPGYATFTVTPHPAGVDAASGWVPTPHGRLHVAWHMEGGKLDLEVDAPAGTVWENDPARDAIAVAAAKAVERRARTLLVPVWRGLGGW